MQWQTRGWGGEGEGEGRIHVAELRCVASEKEVHGGAQDEEADDDPVVRAPELVGGEQNLGV